MLPALGEVKAIVIVLFGGYDGQAMFAKACLCLSMGVGLSTALQPDNGDL